MGAVHVDRYVCSRPGSRFLWFRLAVPAEYQERAGTKLIQRSLKTTDRREASILAGKLRAELINEWRGNKLDNAEIHPTRPDPAAVAVDVGYDQLLARSIERRRAWPQDDIAYAAHLDAREATLRRWTRQFHDGNPGPWEQVADNVIANRPLLAIERGSADYDAFVRSLMEAAIDATDVFIRQNNGELDAEPRTALVRGVKSVAERTARPGETIGELYSAYASWRCQPGRKRRRRPETFEHDRVAIELFAEFVGRDRSVLSITKDDARAFRAMLATFPASRAKNGELVKHGIDECVAIAKRDGLTTLSLTTQAKYLSILSPFFAWLVADAPVTIPVNPFDGLHHKLERGENRRPSFTAEQLNALLTSPLFGSCRGDRGEHKVGNIQVRDWRYWIPLLCLFTGSRITEVAQLHVDDVGIRDGMPLVLLTHDEESGQFIKSKKERLAALHQRVIDAGFLEYWRDQCLRAERDGNQQLFPELVAGKRSLLGDEPARWFRRYLERVKIKNGADGIGAHSFRHTMADAMRAADYLDWEFGQLVLGHSNNSITAAYGALPQGKAERLHKMMKAAFDSEPFRDVDFTGLVAAS